jgi:hypothetical protein
MTGTPPTAISGGDVFLRMRNSVLKGDAQDVGWAEWSIDKLTEDISNVDLWYEYNPSLGTILRERNIRAELTYGDIDFNIQRLGLWLEYSQKSAISEAEWTILKCDGTPQLQPKRYLGVKYGHDGKNVALSIAAKTTDGKIFVEAIDCRPIKNGNGWLFDFMHNPKVERHSCICHEGAWIPEADTSERCRNHHGECHVGAGHCTRADMPQQPDIADEGRV